MGGLEEFPILVAGGGLAGLRAAADLAAAGCAVRLVEAGKCLGGGLARLGALVQTGESPHAGLSDLIRTVSSQPRITVSLETSVTAIAGEPGNFQVCLTRTGQDGQEHIGAAFVVMATGCVCFDPDGLDTLGHGTIADVTTSGAFEAMLAAPGGLARPSDAAPPQSLAFLLCVGSRMRHPVDRAYCSGICCAAALAQALAAKDCRRTIFAIDLRTHVPGAQQALARAEAEGVTIRYARPHTLVPGPQGCGVSLRFVDEHGREHEETVDMAVLAVGMGVPESGRILVQEAGIKTTRHGFVRTDCFDPAATSRPGIFVAGALRGPGEAALAAVQGSAAALAVLGALAGMSAAVAPAAGNASPAALVVGGGAAGLTAALSLAGLGVTVTLLEATDRLGGNPRMHPTVWKGQETRPAMEALAAAALEHPRIAVRLSTRLLGVAGEAGQFRATAATPDGQDALSFGAAVLALGGVEASPDAYLHGRDPRVFTQLEFENWRRTHPETAQPPRSVVFIQCVGAREPEGFPGCARVCCVQALCAAVELKKKRPETQVAVFYRDITAYGESEDLYTEARRLGVLFFRYAPDERPKVERLGASLAVTGVDRLLGRSVRLRPDCLVLAAPLAPSGVSEVAAFFGCDTDAPGFLRPGQPVFSPVDTTRPGVFAAGLCLGPKPLDETVAEARAAAMRAFAFLVKA